MLVSFLKRIRAVREDESGAVTVDWVVLTAAMVGVATALASSFETGLVGALNSLMSSIQIDNLLASWGYSI